MTCFNRILSLQRFQWRSLCVQIWPIFTFEFSCNNSGSDLHGLSQLLCFVSIHFVSTAGTWYCAVASRSSTFSYTPSSRKYFDSCCTPSHTFSNIVKKGYRQTPAHRQERHFRTRDTFCSHKMPRRVRSGRLRTKHIRYCSKVWITVRTRKMKRLSTETEFPQ